jgi:hypothetical protein
MGEGAGDIHADFRPAEIAEKPRQRRVERRVGQAPVCADKPIRVHLLLPVTSPAFEDHKIIGFAGVGERENRPVKPPPAHGSSRRACRLRRERHQHDPLAPAGAAAEKPRGIQQRVFVFRHFLRQSSAQHGRMLMARMPTGRAQQPDFHPAAVDFGKAGEPILHENE